MKLEKYFRLRNLKEKLEKYSALLHSPDFHNEIHHVLSLEKWEKTCQNAAAWLSHISSMIKLVFCFENCFERKKCSFDRENQGWKIYSDSKRSDQFLKHNKLFMLLMEISQIWCCITIKTLIGTINCGSRNITTGRIKKKYLSVSTTQISVPISFLIVIM